MPKNLKDDHYLASDLSSYSEPSYHHSAVSPALSVSMALTATPEAFVSTKVGYLNAVGGTAGLVLADCLTETPTVSVGVIEAGGYLIDAKKINTPLYMFDLQGGPKYD